MTEASAPSKKMTWTCGSSKHVDMITDNTGTTCRVCGGPRATDASKDSILRRWKCVRYCPCEGPRSKAGHFERSDDGAWVLAEDYEYLRAAVKAAAAHLDQPVLYTISESASANSILRGDALQALKVLRAALPAETGSQP